MTRTSTLRYAVALLLASSCASSDEVALKKSALSGGAAPSRPSSHASAAELKCAGEQCTDFGGCTVALLDDDTILSAAHCFEELGWMTIKSETDALREVNAIATDGQGLTFHAGADWATGQALAFVSDGIVMFSPPDETVAPSAVELLANAGSDFYAAGWERDGDQRQAYLYAFSDSTDFNNAKRVLLGAGEPTALQPYQGVDGPHVVVVLKSHLDVNGEPGGRTFASAVDVSLADPNAPTSKSIFYGLSEWVFSAVGVEEEVISLTEKMLTLTFAGNRLGGHGTSPAFQTWILDPALSSDWEHVGELQLPADTGTVVDAVLLGGELVALLRRGSDAVVARIGASGITTEFSVTSDVLARHYYMATADDSSPYLNKAAALRAQELSVYGDRILLSGTVRLDGKNHAVHMALTGAMTLDTSFEVRGIALESTDTSYTLSAVAIGSVSDIYTIGTRRFSNQKTWLYQIHNDDFHAPTVSVRGSNVLQPTFAPGVDLAIAKLESPLAGVATLQLGPMASQLTCVGAGSGTLREGEFQFPSTLDEAPYSDSTRSAMYSDGGDSGGPCFRADGKLAAILVAGDEESGPSGVLGDITVVGSAAVADFVQWSTGD